MTFKWTDDPADPCPYCVHWDEPQNMNSANFEEAVPMLPSGLAERVYRFTHDSCEADVAQYVVEARSGLDPCHTL